jgi:5-methyltetrahydrofolate--homocysteine methyltransferase
MGIWSDQPAIDLQNDFSCLISSRMFEAYFLPSLEQQTRWVERTIYHLDGPGAIRHLDALLSLPRLDGIQWVPGAGAPEMSRWIRLLRRIQAGGKLLVLNCEAWEVETLLAELEPEGLLLSTACGSEEEARELLARVPGWMRRRQWVAA